MLLLIFLVLLLLVVQAGLTGRYLTRQVGNAAQLGPRDDLPAPSPELGRARRALANLQETLPIFLTLAVLSIVLGERGWLSLGGGTIYFLARIGHVHCYIVGLSPWRSMCFAVSMLGLLLMGIALLPHLWN